MNKQDFMARCETIFMKGHADIALFVLMNQWLDAVMRYEHTLFSHGQSQGLTWLEFLNTEFNRTERGRFTLANDAQGYALQEIAAILSHHCQKCAEDPGAWHTRSAFCNHKEAE